ncbi:MAG: hypothetical protein H0U60_06395 [Blastocatellia bacterium]|nr:hypothetical protein [Blastocatellia bacterium]
MTSSTIKSQSARGRLKHVAASAALWLCLVLPSAYVIQRFLGTTILVIYFVVTAIVLAVLPFLKFQVSERRARLFAVLTFAALIALFAIVYPIANTHQPYVGSDDDDALNLAVRSLLHGHYPYYQRTYLDNLIHALPGALIIAAPFVLLGTSALQNLFWFGLLVFVLRRELAETFAALRWFLVMLLLSPVVIHQLVSGTEHVSNAIYAMLTLWWLIRARDKTLPAILWGVALSSRANFLFLIPLAFGWLGKRYGWKNSVKWMGLTSITFAAITLPFYFYDPAGFAPLDAGRRLTRFEYLLPHAAVVITASMALLSIALGLLPMKSRASLWLRCALVQAFPVIVGTLLGGGLLYLAYSTMFLPFGVLAAATHEKDCSPDSD